MIRGMPLREALTLVAKRPGMYTGRHRFDLMVVFLRGVDFAEERNGRPLLSGFTVWLETRGAQSGAVGWPQQVLQLAFPGEDVRPHSVPVDRQRQAVTALFELLDAYLAEREAARDLPG